MFKALSSAVAIALATIASPTPQVVGEASIDGRVLAGSSAEPVSGATVSLVQIGGKALPPVLTGPDGAFHFSGLIAGSYSIQAVKSGFYPGAFGHSSPTDLDTLLILRSQAEHDVIVRLWRSPTISGRVVDLKLKPIAKVTVYALQRRWFGETARLVRVRSARTNDEGTFRFSGLPPGAFVIAVAGDASLIPETTYYPGTPFPGSAQPIEVQAGENREIPDIVADTATAESFAIAGQMLASDGTPAAKVSVTLAASAIAALSSELDSSTAQTDATGRFRFERLRPGSYRISAVLFPPWSPADAGLHGGDRNGPLLQGLLAATPNDPTQWVSQQVDLGKQDLTDLDIRMQTGSRVSGRIEFVSPPGPGPAGVPAPDELPRKAVYVRPVDGRDLGNFPVARIEQDGSFHTVGLPPGKYAIGLAADFPGWLLQKASFPSEDVTGRAFEMSGDRSGLVLSLTTQPTFLEGIVRDDKGGTRLDVTVLVFPEDRSLWKDGRVPLKSRFFAVRPSSDGRFRVPTFPGRYLVAAVPGAVETDWDNPSFLSQAARVAKAQTVSAGSTTSCDLVVTRIR